MTDLAGALAAWREALGAAQVITDAAALAAAGTATYATAQRVPAIIRPASVAEIQAAVRIANAYRTPLYPISAGKNWGYGSRVPPRDGCVILDLGRLDRIADFDATLASVAVEPGVTFRQLHDFLRARDAGVMMTVPGSIPEASVVGNLVERGFSEGLYGEPFAHVCALEIVLPTGACIHTGLDRFAGARAAAAYRWGVGPYVDGLFTQSNLGIVTRMTLWLAPLPAYFQACFFALDDPARLPELLDTLRALKLAGVFAAPVILANEYKTLTALEQYPWAAAGGRTPLPDDAKAHVLDGWREFQWSVSPWRGYTGIHAASRAIGMAQRQVIERELGPRVDLLAFADEEGVAVPRSRTALDFAIASRALHHFDARQSQFFGAPSGDGVETMYWRKRTPPPAAMDLDRDGCGIVWFAPVVPFIGAEIAAVVGQIAPIMRAWGFEPAIAVRALAERSVYVVAAIMFDRAAAGEDARALACYDALLQQLGARGYLPYRLGTHAMGALPPPRDDWAAFQTALKHALDPHHILAPGRYDVGPPPPEEAGGVR